MYTVYAYSPKGFEKLKDNWFMYLNKYPNALLATNIENEQLLVIPLQSAILQGHIIYNGIAVLSLGTVAKSTAKFLFTKHNCTFCRWYTGYRN
jgi:hypothetical protein